MSRLAAVFLLFAPAIFAEQPTHVILPPCESSVYEWTGAELQCLTIDRTRILMSQRNLNMRALEACQAESVFLRAEKVLLRIHDDAERRCKGFGKVFSDELAKCVDP